MKNLKKLSITLAALITLVFAATGPAKAYTWGSITPNYNGGYNWYEYGDNGYSWGSITQNYSGGYNYWGY